MVEVCPYLVLKIQLQNDNQIFKTNLEKLVNFGKHDQILVTK